MKKIFLVLIITMFFSSCENDELNENISNLEIDDAIIVENGILNFSSKDLLSQTVSELKKINNNEKELRFKKYYEKGFMPLFPNFSDDDQDKLLEYSERKKARIQKVIEINVSNNNLLMYKSVPTEIDEDGELVEEFDDDLISDDEFASLLNDEREVIVNDTLYKYTYSGMFSVPKNQKLQLDTYIKNNNIEYLIPDSSSIIRGVSSPTTDIRLSVPTVEMIMDINNDCGSNYQSNELSIADAFAQEDCYGGGGSSSGGGTGGGSSSNTPADHTQSLVELIDDLEACNTLNGFLDSGFGLFGTSKKCYSNFNSDYRTKTKYWKENYLIWNSIGVKVKHQKKGWTGLWRAKKTDEVALSISQASFEYTLDVPNGIPDLYAPPTLYFFEDKIFNNQMQIINYLNDYQKPPFPDVPFVSEVVVLEYVNHWLYTDITVDKMREYFYQGIWQGAKSIVNTYKNRQPKHVTHILFTPQKIFVNYVNLDRRKLNDKKIVNRLDYNFGLGVKFNAYFDSNGHMTTNWGNFLNNPTGFISIPHLYDYENVKMDFVGASRRGNTWKGSRIIYTD